jgi:hypothetical protein
VGAVNINKIRLRCKIKNKELQVKVIILFSITLATMFFLLNPAVLYSSLAASIPTRDNGVLIAYADRVRADKTVNESFMVKANSSTPSPPLLKTKAIAVVIRPPALFPDQNALVNLYKPYLKDSDYVMTYVSKNLNFVNTLPGIKVFSFNTLAEMRQRAPFLKGTTISVIGYDLECCSSKTDINDPVSAIIQASEIAHQNGFKFMPIPGSLVNTPQLAGQFAPYADVYIIQAQAHQQTPSIFQTFVTSMVNAIRSTNLNIPIIVEVSVANRYGQVENVEQDFNTVANIVDGVHIWYKPGSDQLAMVDQFLKWLQQHYR